MNKKLVITIIALLACCCCTVLTVSAALLLRSGMNTPYIIEPVVPRGKVNLPLKWQSPLVESAGYINRESNYVITYKSTSLLAEILDLPNGTVNTTSPLLSVIPDLPKGDYGYSLSTLVTTADKVYTWVHLSSYLSKEPDVNYVVEIDLKTAKARFLVKLFPSPGGYKGFLDSNKLFLSTNNDIARQDFQVYVIDLASLQIITDHKAAALTISFSDFDKDIIFERNDTSLAGYSLSKKRKLWEVTDSKSVVLKRQVEEDIVVETEKQIKFINSNNGQVKWEANKPAGFASSQDYRNFGNRLQGNYLYISGYSDKKASTLILDINSGKLINFLEITGLDLRFLGNNEPIIQIDGKIQKRSRDLKEVLWETDAEKASMYILNHDNWILLDSDQTSFDIGASACMDDCTRKIIDGNTGKVLFDLVNTKDKNLNDLLYPSYTQVIGDNYLLATFGRATGDGGVVRYQIVDLRTNEVIQEEDCDDIMIKGDKLFARVIESSGTGKMPRILKSYDINKLLVK